MTLQSENKTMFFIKRIYIVILPLPHILTTSSRIVSLTMTRFTTAAAALLLSAPAVAAFQASPGMHSRVRPLRAVAIGTDESSIGMSGVSQPFDQNTGAMTVDLRGVAFSVRIM